MTRGPEQSDALSVDEARAALVRLVSREVGNETLDLADAHGRTLAAAIEAPFDVPRYANAALDGIALAWPEDAPRRWSIIGSVFAGDDFTGELGVDTCVRITTGAPLPAGTDTVIPREQFEEREGQVLLTAPARVVKGQNVRQTGEELAAGATVLGAGSHLDAAALGLLAAFGLARVSVIKRPVVALFSTGNEVIAPGGALPPAGVFDANRFALMGLLREHDACVLDLGILPDEPAAIEAALAGAAARSDLVLTSAGVSAGERDFTRAALDALGQLAFWRVALRPGRPLAAGLLGERRTPFVGLPGNPVAAMVAFHQFVAPLLARLQGLPAAAPGRLAAVLETPIQGRRQRTDLLRGVYRCDAQGQLHVRITGAQGSGMLTSMVVANCLIELGDDQNAAAAGEIVSIQPLAAPQPPATPPSTDLSRWP